MADELSDTASGATKGLLGTVGFILILLGAEILVDRAGERHLLGFGLIGVGVPIFFAAFLWRRAQQWIASGVAQKVNWISADPMWWVATLSVFTTFSLNQIGLMGTMIWLLPLGVGYAIYSWRKAGKREKASPLKHDDIDIIYSPLVTLGPPQRPKPIEDSVRPMKKQTKQSRKTARRKDRQKRVRQMNESLFRDWLRSPGALGRIAGPVTDKPV